MKLLFLERVQLSQVLAGIEGNVATLRLVRRLREALSFTDHEIETHGIAEDLQRGLVTWASGGDVLKEFTFSGAAMTTIIGRLRFLDDQGRLPLAFLGMAEKFLVPPAAEDQEPIVTREADDAMARDEPKAEAEAPANGELAAA